MEVTALCRHHHSKPLSRRTHHWPYERFSCGVSPPLALFVVGELFEDRVNNYILFRIEQLVPLSHHPKFYQDCITQARDHFHMHFMRATLSNSRLEGNSNFVGGQYGHICNKFGISNSPSKFGEMYRFIS